jgi:hypothetical protein
MATRRSRPAIEVPGRTTARLAPASGAGHPDEAGRLGADDDALERQAFVRTLEGTTTAQ